MKEILINYEAVYSKTAEMKNHIRSNLLTQTESEYSQIQSMLDDVDGATNARLKKEMEANRRKTQVVMQSLEKLISFIASSAKEFEQKEKQIADVFKSGGNNAKGVAK